MEQNIIEIVQKSFEDIKITDETWFEFWSARDLMGVLWYKEWRKFEWVIEKAKYSCKNSLQKPEDHFVRGDKMINLWKWWKRNIDEELVSNAKETRSTMLKRWIVPEELRAQEDLKLIEKRRLQEIKKLENKDKNVLK